MKSRHSSAAALMLIAASALLTACGGHPPGSGSDDDIGDVCAGTSCVFVTLHVSPERQVVQVGSPASFSPFAAGVTAGQWQRSSDGVTYVDIPGATNPQYTLASATLADDMTFFRVRAKGPDNVPAYSNAAQLLVSTQTPLVIADDTFVDADWHTDPLSSPALFTHTEGQQASGGNPGAWRRTMVALPAGTASLRLSNLGAGGYDPAQQGAVRAIDFAEDCSTVENVRGSSSAIVLFQNGRTYSVKTQARCDTPTWSRIQSQALFAADFVLLAGPACDAGEACPNLSATGAELRFGYLTESRLGAGEPAQNYILGIDNWSVSIWRH